MAAPLPRAVLDVDVIFSRVLHELFGRIAVEARLLDLIWSDELLSEAKRALRERKGVSDEVAERWVGYLAAAFPAGRVVLADLPAGVDTATLTIDPDDEHVCALAVTGGANLLFTFDRGYQREALGSYGIEVVDPDVWLSSAVASEPVAFLEVVERQASVWGGGRPFRDLLDAFERANVSALAAGMRELLGS